MASHAFHQLYFHFAWSTKDRLPLITENVRDWLIRCVTEECPKRGGVLLACNAMPDHVHLCVSLPPTTCAEFIAKIKGASSRLFNQRFEEEKHLMWQEGYGVITFRKGEAEKVVRYIQNQQEIHAKRKAARLLETMAADEYQ
jgi:REP element-mobilizing transposase RayT